MDFMPELKHEHAEDFSKDGRRGKRPPRISIPLKENGQPDVDNTRDGSRERIMSAIKADPDAFSGLGLTAKTIDGISETKPGPITEFHVNVLLTGIEFGSKIGIPLYIKGQSKGQVYDTELAEIAFAFTPQERAQLVPKGVKWLNEVLPEWAKEWIAKLGPGGEFIGLILLMEYAKMKMYLAMWKEKHQGSGLTVEGQSIPPAESQQPAQPVNGQMKQETVA